MDLRKMLFQNIVLSGGSTVFRGFGDRLLCEIKKLVAKDTKIRVSIRRTRPLIIKHYLTRDNLLFNLHRYLLHMNVCTQHGWAVQFWLLWIRLRRCGFPRGSTTRRANGRSIGKHSKRPKIIAETTFLCTQPFRSTRFSVWYINTKSDKSMWQNKEFAS